MRIAQIAPLFEAVPPELYGGTERVVHALTEELVRRGHDVTLFASGDSRTSARLVSGATRALRLDPDSRDKLAPHLAMLQLVTEMSDQFDLIHNHTDYLAYPFIRRWHAPTVTTLHGRLDLPEFQSLYRRFRGLNLISISDQQRAPLAPVRPNWIRTVYNGVNTDRLRFSAEPGDYLVFLGRLSEEKRPDLAIEVARRLGMPIKIAAKLDPTDRGWYDRHVANLLDDPLVDYLGEVDESAKSLLLSGARALVFPTMWPEPFGMVMIEAMACGTPVVALRYGAVPEVLRDGETGFICDSVDDLVRAAARVGDIDRRGCRDWVETHFSAAAMAEGYEAAYARVVGGRLQAALLLDEGVNLVDAREPSRAARPSDRAGFAPDDRHLDLAAGIERHLDVAPVTDDVDVERTPGDA